MPAAGPVTPWRGGVILAIETSCDDTCAAVVTPDGEIRSNVISSQGVHDRYGGVVPEVAARHHLELATPVVDDALPRAGATLDDVDLVAVTQGPGLVGALLVGVATAKGLAAARPAAGRRRPPAGPRRRELPRPRSRSSRRSCASWPAGHTFLARVDEHDGFEVLGRTLDDAAGEAFDKGARLLGLPFPGGPALERLAAEGDPRGVRLPDRRRRRRPGLLVRGPEDGAALQGPRPRRGRRAERRADLAASYQHAIVEALALRVERGLEQTGLGRLAVGGGVAANGPLRERMAGPRRRAARPAARAVHGQRGDDRQRGALGRAARGAALALDAYATGERGLWRETVTLYGRRAAICATTPRGRAPSACAPGAVRLEEVDIEADDALLRRYLERIPVVALDGEELFDYFVDEEALRARL